MEQFCARLGFIYMCDFTARNRIAKSHRKIAQQNRTAKLHSKIAFLNKLTLAIENSQTMYSWDKLTECKNATKSRAAKSDV